MIPNKRYFIISEVFASGENAVISDPVPPSIFLCPTSILNIFFTKNREKKVRKPDITGVAIHPRAISPSSLKFIFLMPLYSPIPITHPTITCELETGTIGIGGSPRLIKRFDNAEEEKMNKTSD